MILIKIYKEWSILNTVKISFCKLAVPLIKFATKDEKMTPPKNAKKTNKKKTKRQKTSKKKEKKMATQPIFTTL